MLNFVDLKPYTARLEESVKKTNLLDSITVGFGKVDKRPLVIAAMDFNFIGGSIGSVMGEKIALAVDYAIEQKCPLMIISKSGGARMMESAYSLMQMAKTTAKLTQLSAAGLPYFSFLTDPTTGGVTASFAMIGDINIAEPDGTVMKFIRALLILLSIQYYSYYSESDADIGIYAIVKKGQKSV